MYDSKTKLQSYLTVLLPSSISIIIGIFLSIFAIILNQFAEIRQLLQIPHNVELMRIVTGWLDRTLTSVIGQTRTETVVVGLFWAVVGVVVYIFLRSVVKFMTELDEDISARSFIWPKGTNRLQPLQLLIEQIVFRIGALIGLILIIFVPLAAVLRGPVFVNFFGTSKFAQYTVWFIASMVVWHVITVLLRLIALKPRLFS